MVGGFMVLEHSSLDAKQPDTYLCHRYQLYWVVQKDAATYMVLHHF